MSIIKTAQDVDKTTLKKTKSLLNELKKVCTSPDENMLLLSARSDSSRARFELAERTAAIMTGGSSSGSSSGGINGGGNNRDSDISQLSPYGSSKGGLTQSLGTPNNSFARRNLLDSQETVRSRYSIKNVIQYLKTKKSSTQRTNLSRSTSSGTPMNSLHTSQSFITANKSVSFDTSRIRTRSGKNLFKNLDKDLMVSSSLVRERQGTALSDNLEFGIRASRSMSFLKEEASNRGAYNNNGMIIVNSGNIVTSPVMNINTNINTNTNTVVKLTNITATTPLSTSGMKKAQSLMSLYNHRDGVSNHSCEDQSPETSEYTLGTLQSEDCLDNIKVSSFFIQNNF